MNVAQAWSSILPIRRLAAAVCTFFLLFGWVAQVEAATSRVLFISSYDPSFHSFLPQLNGLKAGLAEGGHGPENTILNVEFMDTKRIRNVENVAAFRERLASKFTWVNPPDVLVVGDDNALKFALQERNDLFEGIPIVFLGVNNVKLARSLNADPTITGVVEKPSLGENLDLAAKFLSETGTIHLIRDVARSSNINMQRLRETPAFQRLGERVEVLRVTEFSFEELFGRVEQIEPGSVIYLMGANKDKNGDIISNVEMARELHKRAKVPYFHPWEYSMGNGALGGIVVSHMEQGRVAGKLASQVLGGATISELPVVANSPNVYTIDFNVMREFKLRLGQFPPGANILNQPTSFYDKYWQWVIFGLAFFAVQTIALIGMAVLNRRLKRTEGALSTALKTAEDANKAKSEFLASMSHEIRTPMTGIMGFADMLLDDRLDAHAKTKVQKIKSSAAALLKILNDILDLSKLEAGKLELEQINFDPARVAQEVCQLFYDTCPEGKKDSLTITTRVSGDLPAAVCADPTRLRQVLINLMGNAVKFTDSGSVTLICDADRATNTLKFSVEDTGIGIGDEMQEWLFEAFVQADATISRQYHGTGLGLSICKRLVDLMGGEIGLQSKLGEGSTFWFNVPYEPLPDDFELVHPEDLSQREYMGSRELSVLVAEDNEINQTIIKAILDRMGHRGTFVWNGTEAVDAVKQSDFDLILMDVRMPVLSGPDATKQIRQLPGFKATTPIIALTADVMAESRALYVEVGMNECVPKPINPEELAVAINKVMGETINLTVAN